jgi:hypothetical protein
MQKRACDLDHGTTITLLPVLACVYCTPASCDITCCACGMCDVGGPPGKKKLASQGPHMIGGGNLKKNVSVCNAGLMPGNGAGGDTLCLCWHRSVIVVRVSPPFSWQPRHTWPRGHPNNNQAPMSPQSSKHETQTHLPGSQPGPPWAGPCQSPWMPGPGPWRRPGGCGCAGQSPAHLQ